MATLDDLIEFKAKAESGLAETRETKGRDLDNSILRAVNSAIDKPPEGLDRMSRDDLKMYIAEQSFRHVGKSPGLGMAFDIPGAALAELPLQIKRHGFKKGAIRTGEALMGTREYSTPTAVRLPIDVLAFGGGSGIKSGYNYLKGLKKGQQVYTTGRQLAGKGQKMLADPYARVLGAERGIRPIIPKEPKMLVSPQKQITGGQKVYYQSGTVKEPYRIIEKTRVQATAKPTPEMDFNKKAKALEGWLGKVDAERYAREAEALRPLKLYPRESKRIRDLGQMKAGAGYLKKKQK
jgi:hypothetical protein